ncbi:MAG: tetratricopeptide repeat protein [Candidatus Acidiferrum sp.]
MTVVHAASREEASLPQESNASIKGTVRDSSGAPIAGATMLLEEKGNSNIVKAKTNAEGTYVLTTDHAGTYTVRAVKSGWIDTVADSIVLSPGDKKRVDLVLSLASSVKFESSASTPPAKAPPGTMEFADEPNFTVAGVTDWSNLGLHGSAVTSQTSESLAKETLALKSGEPEAASEGKPGKQYEAALSYRAKGDFAGARAQVRKTLAVANNAEGHRLLGELDEQLGDPLEAVHEYEQAARMDPSEQNYFEWGTELLLHKAAEPAVEVFSKGSRAHPNSARMLTGLGAALYSSGSWEEAARRLCAASDLQPADPAPYLFLGKIEKATRGPLPCSEQKLARFARQQPGNALANYYYAISLWKREKGSENPTGLKQAEALLEKAVTIDPSLDEAYLQLGVLHSAQGESEKAIREYQKAIEVNPRLSEAHRQLGLAYQRMGDKAKAQQEFEAYEQAENTETAERERQQRELRQFLIILKDQPAAASPH